MIVEWFLFTGLLLQSLTVGVRYLAGSYMFVTAILAVGHTITTLLVLWIYFWRGKRSPPRVISGLSILSFISLISQELMIETDPSKPVVRRLNFHDGVLASELGVVLSSVGLMGVLMSVLLKRRIIFSDGAAVQPLARRLVLSCLSSFVMLTGILRLVDGVLSEQKALTDKSRLLDESTLFWFQVTNYCAVVASGSTVLIAFVKSSVRKGLAILLPLIFLAALGSSIHFDIKVFNKGFDQKQFNIQLINGCTLILGMIVSAAASLTLLFDAASASRMKNTESKEVFSETLSEGEEEPLKEKVVAAGYSTSDTKNTV